MSCEPLITSDRAAELLRLHPKTVKRLAQAGELPGLKIGPRLALSGIVTRRMDVRTVTVLRPPESERGSAAMRTRYQHAKEEMPERHSTNLAYRSYIETHIRPKWADWPLSKLVAKGASFTVEQWLKSMDLAPKTKGNIR